jgi:prepilin-type N-terminal cleavage/methylation domain-containing protein
MLRKLITISKRQQGFTIIELIIAVAITGLIMGGIALTFVQLVEGHTQSSGEMTALRQVQNIGYNISRDAKMAEIIDINDDEATAGVTEVFTVYWTEIISWKTEPVGEGEDIIDFVISMINRHKIVYTWDDGIVDRSEYQTGSIREDEESYTYSLDTETRIAQYIKDGDGNMGITFDIGANILTVTATTEGFNRQTETRSYEIEPRPDIIYWQ